MTSSPSILTVCIARAGLSGSSSPACTHSARHTVSAGGESPGSAGSGTDWLGLNEPVWSTGEGDDSVKLVEARTGQEAFELLRTSPFDLVIVGDELPDIPVAAWVQRMRIARPWQKWAFVGSQLTDQDEIAARMLGATAVLDAPVDISVLVEIARSIRQHAVRAEAIEKSVAGGGAGQSDESGDGLVRRTRRGRPTRRSTAARTRDLLTNGVMRRPSAE